MIKFEKDFLTQVKKPNLLEDIVNIIAGTNFGDTVNKQTGTSLRYTFKRAFPIAMNSMPLSYNASQLLKVTVTFAYSRYVVDGILKMSPLRVFLRSWRIMEDLVEMPPLF